MSPIPVSLIVRAIGFLFHFRDEVHDSRDGHDLIREHDLKTVKDREKNQEELYGSADRDVVLQRIYEQQIFNHLKQSGLDRL